MQVDIFEALNKMRLINYRSVHNSSHFTNRQFFYVDFRHPLTHGLIGVNCQWNRPLLGVSHAFYNCIGHIVLLLC